MEEKFKVVDFARIIGCGVKTVYRLIDDGRLRTVKDIQNGRTISFIVANDEEISELVRIYQKTSKTVSENDGKYYDNVTENDFQGQSKVIQNQAQSDIIDRIMTFSEGINEQILTLNSNYNKKIDELNNELNQYKSKLPLLEDRQGLYLQEISDIKSEKDRLISDYDTKLSEKDKEKNRQFIIFSVIIIFFMTITVILAMKLYDNMKNPVVIEKVNTIETVREVSAPIKTVENKNTPKTTRR